MRLAGGGGSRKRRGRESLPWAIVPTAGDGRRLRPATETVPKALLPVGLRPMLDWALDEALDAGAQAVAVVVSARHPGVRRHVERRAAAAGWPRRVQVHLVEQPRPLGLGDALSRCRTLTGSASFGVVVPDNWFAADVPALAQVAETHLRTGLDTIGLVRVEPARAALLGNVGRVDVEPLGGDDYRITRLADKAPGSFAVDGDTAVWRGCARYAVGERFYDALDATRPTAEESEWDDVPAFQQLIASSGLAGRRLDATHFDVGHPAGYLAAMSYVFERDFSGSGA